MMTSYLDVDINKLFEDYTIKEIEEIQKKIQAESDRKKVELRTLVGERYRDLILAADAIGKMKVTSEIVISRIGDIQEKFHELQKKYLVGFKTNSIDDRQNKILTGYHRIIDSVVIRIKLLMDVPEHIWSSIEDKDFLSATQLHMVAQHINYSLLFETGQKDLSKRYPIVLRQWDVISQFKNLILKDCNKALQSLDVSAERAANCLASLALLNDTPLINVLEELISRRSDALKSVIKDERDDSVKRRISLCVRILIQTITLIYTCFLNGENTAADGLVSRHIQVIDDQEMYFRLSQSNFNGDLMGELLSSIAKANPYRQNFRQNDYDHVRNQVSLFELQNRVNRWLEWVKSFCDREITKLLDLVTSVKGLHGVRVEAMNLDVPENWNVIWNKLSLPRINFWLEFFQPIITERAKCVIKEKWSAALNEFKFDTTKLLLKASNVEKFEYREDDLRWFIWKDSSCDVLQRLRKHEESDNKRSLLMKTKGFSPNVVMVCEKFDKNLFRLLDDLEQYLHENEGRIRDNFLSTTTASDPVFTDRVELEQHLQCVSTLMIEDFISYVKDVCLDAPTEIESTLKFRYSRDDVNPILTARLLLALTSLCSNLKKCFILSKVSELTVTHVKWQAVCDDVREHSTAIWSIWGKKYKSRVAERREKLMSKETFEGLCIRAIITEWERVTIEEDSGEGKSIKSEIFVPRQPSIPLEKFLTAISKDLNKLIPHTLPKKLLQEIIENVANELMIYYQGVSEKTVNLRQNQAFQILFDIKFCNLLMVSRENKILSDASKKAYHNVLGRIDPFDYDVFKPFIYANIKKSVQRRLLIFGNLVPNLEQLHSILGGRTDHCAVGETGKTTDPPTVLAICMGAPWFPPLAVTAPSRNLPLVSGGPITVTDAKFHRKKVTKDRTSNGRHNDSSGATLKSGAAAFFGGVMGSDWFGTG